MEIAIITDTVTTPIESNHNHNNLGFTNSLNFTLRSQILPIDAVAPPPVKPTTIPKTRTRKRSRVKRKMKTDGFGAGEGGEDGGGFFGDGDGGGGGGSFGSGGSGGFGGFNWDESKPGPADPAFDFVYAALSWFVLSNCLHFAFKRVVRIVVDGAADPGERRFR